MKQTMTTAALAICASSVMAYVPEPQPLKSAVEITALYYPGTEHMPEWDMVAQTRPEAKPLLGWYDEGSPEVISMYCVKGESGKTLHGSERGH